MSPRSAPRGGGGDTAIPIEGLLAEAGFDTTAAALAARSALQSAKLTRDGKRAIAAYKRQPALALLASRFVLVCSSACRALAPEGRSALLSRTRCEICAGSNNRRAMLGAARAMHASGLRRLLVVGGRAEQHRDLSAVFGRYGVSVQGVIGTQVSHSQKDAQANMRRADLMVIWGATELRHAVSNLYTSDPPAGLRFIQVGRRGIEALCSEIARSGTRRQRPAAGGRSAGR